MPARTALDLLLAEDLAPLKGKRIGLVCNQATVSHDFRHILELFLPYHQEGKFHLQSVLGPQHGLYGHTQDNMIEWEGAKDPRTGLVIHSLYGENREPTDAMLEGVELLVIDIPDVGARYYTFVWTMALCMKAAERLGISVLVLDRPNPIGGTQVEGTLLDPAYASFVGLHPVPSRHGMTAGEIATYVQAKFYPGCDLTVKRCEGWSRSEYIDEAGTPWAMPSPNMPTLDTAIVYPGGCLLEATMLSEGRGTTRPFELFGAPYLDGWKLADSLNGLRLPGAYFRPLQFEPTFHKFAKEVCEGCFLQVTDRSIFEPVLAYVAIIQEAIRQAGSKFQWKEPPYEYVWDKLPFDILAGNAWLRSEIELMTPISVIRQRFRVESDSFEPTRHEFLLYGEAV